MKRPLVALLFAPEFHAAIKNGEKEITIREGLRAYQVGETVMLCCHVASWCRMATVTRVVHQKFLDISLMDLLRDGFVGHETALTEMGKFYSDLNMNSDMTVIEFNAVT